VPIVFSVLLNHKLNRRTGTAQYFCLSASINNGDLAGLDITDFPMTSAMSAPGMITEEAVLPPRDNQQRAPPNQRLPGSATLPPLRTGKSKHGQLAALLAAQGGGYGYGGAGSRGGVRDDVGELLTAQITRASQRLERTAAEKIGALSSNVESLMPASSSLASAQGQQQEQQQQQQLLQLQRRRRQQQSRTSSHEEVQISDWDDGEHLGGDPIAHIPEIPSDDTSDVTWNLAQVDQGVRKALAARHHREAQELTASAQQLLGTQQPAQPQRGGDSPTLDGSHHGGEHDPANPTMVNPNTIGERRTIGDSRERFAKYDRDGDGELSVDEIGSLFRDMEMDVDERTMRVIIERFVSRKATAHPSQRLGKALGGVG
jgi:hypothetical protein